MRLSGRLKAAAEVIEEIFERHRPASQALSDWGARHRFAGSGDRAAIGTLVYDVLRRRLSLSAQMQTEAARALVLAAAPRAFGLEPAAIIAAADGSDHGLAPLSVSEQALLVAGVPDSAPAHIKADVPAWLFPSFERAFGANAVAEGRAMAERAPIDLRVNTLKATREKVLKALEKLGATATHLSPLGVRIPPPAGAAKSPHVEAEAAHGKGWFEVQDEGSQLAAMLVGAKPRAQVLDLCAGAGGKTLALAAALGNTGQIYAYDADKSQLRPIFERLKRAGARNVQVMDGGDVAALESLGPRFDAVLVDAPCTGSGTWRRRPDSKWRVSPENLAQRLLDQRAVLELASRLVKHGGSLTYVTCSVLPEENVGQISWFLETHPQYQLSPWSRVWTEAVGGVPPRSADGSETALLLTPHTHGTDGFFVARFDRVS